MLEEKINNLERNEKDKIINYTNSWEEKGKIKGKLEGKIEGKLEGKCESYLSLLKKGFTKEEITNLLDLSSKELEGVEKLIKEKQ